MASHRRLTSFLCPLGVLTLSCLLVLLASPLQAQQIQVTAADPPSAAQGTVNLNVSIKGKGFKKGAVARFVLTGTDDTDGVAVNSTTFVNAGELTASISVAETATIAKFDIVVKNNDGRIGKGTEMFAVTSKQAACPALTPVLTSSASCTTAGQAGCLDETFGGTGVVLTDTTGGVENNDWEQAVQPLMQADGKIVAVGYSKNNGSTTGNDFTLVRYNIDGSLDTTFGSGGIARGAVSSRDDNVEAAVLQPDGKILAAGGSDGSGKQRIAVARFNLDGTLDPTFGAGGSVLLDSPSRKYGWSAFSIAVQTDGKILLGTSSYGAVVRLNADGSLDSTFGNGGIVAVNGYVWALNTQRLTLGPVPEARTLVAGNDPAPGPGAGFSLMRLMPNGTVDAGFGPSGTGKIYTNFCAGDDRPRSVAVDAAGNIVVAGTAGGGSSVDFGIARYTSGGMPDPAFGDLIPGSLQRIGRTRVDFFGGNDFARGVVAQPDGKLIMSGNIGMARFNADGTLDTTFGTGGLVTTHSDVLSSFDYGRGLVLAADGRIIMVGTAVANGTDNFAVARYWH